jgi:hypothetical protein
MTRDLKNNIAIFPTILPVNATANTTGVAVALAGYESCVAEITTTTASVGGTFKLTECATSGGSYTDVAVADIITNGTYALTTGIAVVEDETVSVGYIGSLGFIKGVFTHSATGVISANVILSNPLIAPTEAN